MPGLVLPLRRSNNRLNKPITITPRPARVIVCMYHGFAGTTGGGTGSGSGLAWPVTGAGLATLSVSAAATSAAAAGSATAEAASAPTASEIGRASCRERVWQYV